MGGRTPVGRSNDMNRWTMTMSRECNQEARVVNFYILLEGLSTSGELKWNADVPHLVFVTAQDRTPA